MKLAMPGPFAPGPTVQAIHLFSEKNPVPDMAVFEFPVPVEKIEIDSRVRLYGEAAVVTGQTRMQGHYGEQHFGAHSRHTHVYVRTGRAWRLASAQGTPIAAVGG